ncbi:catalase/peroxidase HPI [Thecamonas trahens ATCC 50062]|uniref:Catalase-peroxidase n=1 Tax=Thecamonas trahens ATCC 50062 TaxID=461836 RepID=A0A0L0DNC8_THETB|nr:catalase/peroxidase HPI [Thecamonas trahens ATCC 50062]KNC53760.1 catalase/peroxidase HPI [Thecamonas trahens ATCC 50062]|eukprot:XP_013754323.1 catalase/peroxidase HPI [Thecamonas trahens ATCC 50062]
MSASSSTGRCPNKSKGGTCPFKGHTNLAVGAPGIREWWPNSLNLKPLVTNSGLADPMGEDFDYAAEFAKVNLDELRNDVMKVMTTSQDWWPADYGHYGPFFIRMSWHAAGTYRVSDGRGGAGTGMQRFAPLNSWPDNANLDKARRLLWPIKKKYGRKISWADLIVYAGNLAIESMGLETVGFGFGRIDKYEPEDIFWGAETEWLTDSERYPKDGKRELAEGLGAVEHGLIYVNPEGPGGEPDPMKAAADIRESFGRMAMNDEETVALIAGGHTFGKAHGAADPSKYVGPEPEGESITARGLGWNSSYKSGAGAHAITSGLEGAWTPTPIQWDNSYFDMLFGYEWELTKSPAGASQWTPKGGSGSGLVPDAHDEAKSHPPIMFTTDLALRIDPDYERISRHFHSNPEAFGNAFARAWFKLLHRDMGPIARYLGPLVPTTPELWQDPLPSPPAAVIDADDIATLKAAISASDLTPAQLVRTAWASASTYRDTDKRGGANGARIRLSPQKDWPVNDPPALAAVLAVYDGIQANFNAGAKSVSMADLIVLGGVVGVEAAAAAAGHDICVAFTPGRTDASQDQTDTEGFAVLEPTADAFRNYYAPDNKRPAEQLLVDKTILLGITSPEMAVLLAGLRVIGANAAGSDLGVLTDRPGALTTDFFVNILDDSIDWAPAADGVYVGTERGSGATKWSATRADLIFSSNSQLRALAEVFAADDAADHFVNSFAAAWAKVMDLDRFDLRSRM